MAKNKDTDAQDNSDSEVVPEEKAKQGTEDQKAQLANINAELDESARNLANYRTDDTSPDFSEDELNAAIDRYADYEMDDTGLDDTKAELNAAIDQYADYEMDDTGLDDTKAELQAAIDQYADYEMDDTGLDDTEVSNTEVGIDATQEASYSLEQGGPNETNEAEELAAKQANFIDTIAAQISVSGGSDKEQYVKAANMAYIFDHTKEIDDNGVTKHKLAKSAISKDMFDSIETAAASLSAQNKDDLCRVSPDGSEITFSQAGKESIEQLSRAAKGGKELLVEQSLVGKVFGDNGLVNKAIDPITYKSEAKKAVLDLREAKKTAVKDIKSSIRTERIYTALVSTPIRYAGKVTSCAIGAIKGEQGFVDSFKEARKEIKEARQEEKAAYRIEAFKEGVEELKQFIDDRHLSDYSKDFLKASENSKIDINDLDKSSSKIRKAANSAAKEDLKDVKNNGVRKVAAKFISSWRDRVNNIEIEVAKEPKEAPQTIAVGQGKEEPEQTQANVPSTPAPTTYRDRERKSPANKPVDRTVSPVQATSKDKTTTPNQDRLSASRQEGPLSEKDSPVKRT